MTETAPGAGSEGASSPNAGWTHAQGSTNTAAFDAQTEVAATAFTGTTHPDGSINTGAGAGDCLRSANKYTGTFDAGNWTVNFSVIGVTVGAQNATGRIRCRLFRSANADGSGATEITSAAQDGGTINNWGTSSPLVSTATFNPGSFSVADEYLFVELAWQRTQAGVMAGTDAIMYLGNAAANGTRVVSPNFTASGTPTNVAAPIASAVADAPTASAIPGAATVAAPVASVTVDAPVALPKSTTAVVPDPASVRLDVPQASLLSAAILASDPASVRLDVPPALVVPGAATVAAPVAGVGTDTPSATAVGGPVAAGSVPASVTTDAPTAVAKSVNVLAAEPASVRLDVPQATLLQASVLFAGPASVELGAPAAGIVPGPAEVAAPTVSVLADAPGSALALVPLALPAAPASVVISVPAARARLALAPASFDFVPQVRPVHSTGRVTGRPQLEALVRSRARYSMRLLTRKAA